FPTIAAIAGLPKSAMLQPQDGQSLRGSIEGRIPKRRKKPLSFRFMEAGALVDNQYKLVTQKLGSGEYEMYDLAKDPKEGTNVIDSRPEIAKRLVAVFEKWSKTVDASDEGKDYPEGRLTDPNPRRMFWTDLPGYEPYFEEWKKRPEYESRLKDK
ncbi:MAG: N-acetylgalactosamine 6-sulfate sulfatase, partial [Opitutales bacterium]|nr:N-acetylgalactosamine 6-sulfate sulfatase [Opitutales bacterium]